MPALQVRELPAEVHAALVRAARSENRSVAQQTVVELRRALGLDAGQSARRQALLERLASQQRVDWDGLPDPAALVREDRDR
ncbi:MAG: hypothetical protein J0I14_17735 [Propionibacteriaceae bacterium]|jgi:plasmid stability protein|nr:hypothetical protein [Propionibacteriaceae bacterium]